MRTNGIVTLGSWAGAAFMIVACALSARAKDQAPAVKVQPATSGHELFTREWLPNDSRAWRRRLGPGVQR